MTTYILLRKNKESGPFGLEELKNQELKADDLIWVEGQSACWLNPGEIKQLKDLVGVVPEKQEDLSRFQPTEMKVVPEKISEAQAQKKSEENTVSPVKKEASVYNSYATIKKIKKVPVVVRPEPVIAETHYAKSLDEIKEMYVKNLEKKQRISIPKIQIPPQVKRIAFYAGLVLIGLLAGFVFKRSGSKEKIAANQQIQNSNQPVNNPVNENNNLQLPSTVQDNNSDVMVNDSENDKPVTSEKQTVRKEPVKENESPVIPEKKEIVNEPQNNVERVAQTRDDTKETHKSSAGDLSGLVSVKSSDYTVASFGGIRNLQLTVKNDSKYVLDKVTVELQYLKPRDELLRSENIVFESVAPNASQTMAIKKTNRGVKVNCKVIRIEPREGSASTAGL